MFPVCSSRDSSHNYASSSQLLPRQILANPEILRDDKIYDMVVKKVCSAYQTNLRVDQGQTENVTGLDLKFYIQYGMQVDREIESIREISSPTEIKIGLTDVSQPSSSTTHVIRYFPSVCKIIENLKNEILPKLPKRFDRDKYVRRRNMTLLFAKKNFEEVLRSQNDPCWKSLINYDHPNKLFSGWKIHVSATEESCEEIAKVVVPYLFYRYINSKICSNKEYLSHFSQIDTQKGKFITIYPKDEHDADMIASEINSLFTYFKLDLLPKHVIKGDAQIGDSGNVYLRYGKLQRRNPNDDACSIPRSMMEKTLRVQDRRFFPMPNLVMEMNWSFTQEVTWNFPGTNFVMDLKEMRNVGSNLLDVVDPGFILDKLLPNITKDELLLFTKTYLEITDHLLEVNEAITDKKDLSFLHDWRKHVESYGVSIWSTLP